MIVDDRPAELAPPRSTAGASQPTHHPHRRPEPARSAPGRRKPRFTTGGMRWRSPVPRHRRLGPPGAGSVLGALVLLIAVMVVGGRVVDSQLDDDERFREFVYSGAPGEPVSARTFEVTVRELRTAKVIDGGEFLHDTAGVWVLVRVQAAALRETAGIGYAAVRDAEGQVMHATERVDQPLANFGYRLQPGVPVEADVVFELPADATGLTLRLADSNNDLRLNAVAEIGLPELPEPVDEELPIEDPQVVVSDQAVLDGEPDSRE